MRGPHGELPLSLSKEASLLRLAKRPLLDELRACRPGERLTLAPARRSDRPASCAGEAWMSSVSDSDPSACRDCRDHAESGSGDSAGYSTLLDIEVLAGSNGNGSQTGCVRLCARRARQCVRPRRVEETSSLRKTSASSSGWCATSRSPARGHIRRSSPRRSRLQPVRRPALGRDAVADADAASDPAQRFPAHPGSSNRRRVLDGHSGRR
jgi:hypothetical protein